MIPLTHLVEVHLILSLFFYFIKNKKTNDIKRKIFFFYSWSYTRCSLDKYLVSLQMQVFWASLVAGYGIKWKGLNRIEKTRCVNVFDGQKISVSVEVVNFIQEKLNIHSALFSMIFNIHKFCKISQRFYCFLVSDSVEVDIFILETLFRMLIFFYSRQSSVKRFNTYILYYFECFLICINFVNYLKGFVLAHTR